jgi:hypothetical protein
MKCFNGIEADMKPPFISDADVEAEIALAQYYIFPGTTLMACCLTLRNGTTTIGMSNFVNPGNFNEDISKQAARNMAKLNIYPMLGYARRESIYKENGKNKETP